MNSFCIKICIAVIISIAGISCLKSQCISAEMGLHLNQGIGQSSNKAYAEYIIPGGRYEVTKLYEYLTDIGQYETPETYVAWLKKNRFI